MGFIEILKIIIAVVTVGFGAFSVVFPQRAARFTGLSSEGTRGISEIRAVLGGTFVGLGLALLFFRSPGAYRTLGTAYLAIAAVRGGSIWFDRSPATSNWTSLVSEVVFGIILLI